MAVNIDGKYSYICVVNEFIERGIRDGVKDLSIQKLQRLLFFTQGFSVGLYDSPLIKEDFYCYKGGPGVKEFYSKLDELIEQRGWGERHKFCELIEEPDGIVLTVDENDLRAIEVINSVWFKLKSYSVKRINKLSKFKAMFRVENPWEKHFDREGLFVKIPLSDITFYFKELLDLYGN